jgi:hypothetical protein
MSFINAQSHLGNLAYIWSGAVGNTTDTTLIDPKRAGRNVPGRGAIGVYVGSVGNLVLEVPNPDGYAGSVGNMYFAGLVAGQYLDIKFTKVLASGNVKDSAPGGVISNAKTSTAKDLVIFWGV